MRIPRQHVFIEVFVLILLVKTNKEWNYSSKRNTNSYTNKITVPMLTQLCLFNKKELHTVKPTELQMFAFRKHIRELEYHTGEHYTHVC
jgi:hypothetical protein